MDFAQVDSTLEFTLESSVNLPRRTQRPTIDLNKTPFQMKDEHLARIRDLSKTG
jgi:regulatory protein NPR1